MYGTSGEMCMPEDALLIPNPNSPLMDIVEFFNLRGPEVVNNDLYVVARVVDKDKNNKALNAGGNKDSVDNDPVDNDVVQIQSTMNKVGVVDQETKRKKERPRNQTAVINEGSSVTSCRKKPSRACKKYKDAATIPCFPETSESAGRGFLVHIIIVRATEDILGNLLSFTRSKEQAVCVLSANGSISRVALGQSSSPGGTVTYEGCYEILSLSGSFLPAESSPLHSITGSLSVSLAGLGGPVLGGGVAGIFTAASAVQITVGTFLVTGHHVASP